MGNQLVPSSAFNSNANLAPRIRMTQYTSNPKIINNQSTIGSNRLNLNPDGAINDALSSGLHLNSMQNANSSNVVDSQNNYNSISELDKSKQNQAVAVDQLYKGT